MKQFALLTLLVVATVLMALAFTAAANPKLATQPPVVAAMPAATPAAAPPEEHPHIHAALESMRAAKHELESAAHDFHGHRVESIKHLDAAIHEAEICEHER
jgi:hypothetical protein